MVHEHIADDSANVRDVLGVRDTNGCPVRRRHGLIEVGADVPVPQRCRDTDAQDERGLDDDLRRAVERQPAPHDPQAERRAREDRERGNRLDTGHEPHRLHDRVEEPECLPSAEHRPGDERHHRRDERRSGEEPVTGLSRGSVAGDQPRDIAGLPWHLVDREPAEHVVAANVVGDDPVSGVPVQRVFVAAGCRGAGVDRVS